MPLLVLLDTIQLGVLDLSRQQTMKRPSNLPILLQRP